MNILSVRPEVLEYRHSGSYATVAKGEALDAILAKRYNRLGLCIKVFPKLKEVQPDEFLWTGQPLRECTRAQNLFALHDLAPLVLDVVILNGRQAAQVTEYADGQGAPNVALMKALLTQNNIHCVNMVNGQEQQDLEFDCNWRGRWFVDFGGFWFADPVAYERQLLDRIAEITRQLNQNSWGTAIVRLTRLEMELANWLGHWQRLRRVGGAE